MLQSRLQKVKRTEKAMIVKAMQGGGSSKGFVTPLGFEKYDGNKPLNSHHLSQRNMNSTPHRKMMMMTLQIETEAKWLRGNDVDSSPPLPVSLQIVSLQHY